MKKTVFAVGVCCGMLVPASGQIFFDDFNIDEGHFGFTPTFTGSTTGVASGTADRVTTSAPFEGAGHQKIAFVPSGFAPLRIRYLSGGPPYTSGTAGNPENNIQFTTTAGVNGNIGFYLRTDIIGLDTLIALDTASVNNGTGMYGAVSTPIIGDGQWHLYEWSLDGAVWGSVPGITTKTTGTLPNNTYSIDSIYFWDADGTTPSPGGTIYMDFVALNPDGSVGLLVVPEPTTYAMAFGLMLAGFAGFRQFRQKKS
jgi:hypothetical protein